MDSSYMNFIAYEGQDLFPKIEMGFEETPAFQNSFEKISSDFMFPFETEPRNIFYKAQGSQNLIQSIFNATFNPTSSLLPFDKPKKRVPFQISKLISDLTIFFAFFFLLLSTFLIFFALVRKVEALKKEESSTSDETSISVPIADKVASKSRRIIKREHAKQRSATKPMPLALSREVTQKFSPDEVNELNIDDKSKKKILQMIRNRISAQNSRDRKKVYIRKLEALQKKTAAENDQLLKQARGLKQANEALRLQCEQLKQGLVMCMSETYEKHERCDQKLENENKNVGFRNDIEAMVGSQYGTYGKQSELGPKSMTKYSLALETLLAALMFSNKSQQNAANTELENMKISQSHKIEADLEESIL